MGAQKNAHLDARRIRLPDFVVFLLSRAAKPSYPSTEYVVR